MRKAHRRVVDRVCFRSRALRRSLGLQLPVYFCLNTGRCGSTYLVRLLQANGVKNCYHELQPNLFREGVAYYYGGMQAAAVSRELRRTRAGVFFEANNRLFSLALPIQAAFPRAKFVFLFRDGREVVRSGLQREWYSHTDPFGPFRVGGDARTNQFLKTCRYWVEVNRRILHDLDALGCSYLALRFEDLVSGGVTDQLEDFLHVRLRRCLQLPTVNETSRWSVPPYDQWSPSQKRAFDRICGPMMKQLGYPTSEVRSTKYEVRKKK